MNSFQVILRDLNTGAGRPGLTVTLRGALDNYTSDLLTAEPVSGKPGLYEFTYDIPLITKYKLYANGSQEPSFGGTHGRSIFDLDSSITIVNGKWDAKAKELTGLSPATTSDSAYTKGQAESAHFTKTEVTNFLSTKVNVSGNETITGLKGFETIPRIVISEAGGGALPNPSTDGDLTHLKYLNQRLSAIPSGAYVQSPRVVRVIAGAASVTGKTYGTIKAAVQYCVAQSPHENKQYLVLIEDMGDNSRINASVGSLHDFVHLVGVGKNIEVIVRDGSTSARCLIQNMTLWFGGGLGDDPAEDYSDQTYALMTIDSCKVFHYRSLVMNNCSLVQSKFVSPDTYRVILKNSTDVEGCYFRTEPGKDSHTGSEFYQQWTGYPVPSDPTIPS